MNVFSAHRHKGVGVHINDYLTHLAALKYSPKSIDSYKHGLVRFVAFLEEQNITRPQDVTLDHLAAFRLELTDKGRSVHTIGLYLRSVRKLFAFLEETGQVFINPAHGLVLPKSKAHIRPVPTEDDMNALLSTPDTSAPRGIRDRALLETFYSTGVRLEELVNMNISDLDIKQGRVKVTGKGNKQRVVPMGRQAVFWTDKYLKDVRPGLVKNRLDEHALWIGMKGRKINPQTIERLVKAYGQQAGLSCPITPHALRRACATHMLANGAHPVQIQLLLGHSTMSALSHYLKITVTDMKNMHRKARPGK